MSPRIMFIPVSSPKGVGEYMRSLALAETLLEHDPNIKIRFVLNEAAPYHKDCPFEVDLCPSSPTKNSSLVNKYLSNFRPDLTLFDASGRVSQLEYCAQNNIKTVFICQHRKKLKKGLRLRRLRHTSQIWVVQPKFAIGELSNWAKFKLNLLDKPPPQFIGPIFRTASSDIAKQVLNKFGLLKKQYILFNAGSGGHVVNGINAAEEFETAAAKFARSNPLKIVTVRGPNSTSKSEVESNHMRLESLPPIQFNALLQNSEAAVLGGGSALLQAIHHGVKTVACEISGDQNERIEACVNQNLAWRSELKAENIVEVLGSVIDDNTEIDSSLVGNGLNTAMLQVQKILSPN